MNDLIPGPTSNLNIPDPASDSIPIPNLKGQVKIYPLTNFLIILSGIVYGPICEKLSDSAWFSFLLNWLIKNNQIFMGKGVKIIFFVGIGTGMVFIPCKQLPVPYQVPVVVARQCTVRKRLLEYNYNMYYHYRSYKKHLEGSHVRFCT
jgi:hypothetical protein